jgi:hypothetical protein
MGIRFTCPNGHQLHVKTFLAGKRGVCPKCGASVLVPAEELQTAEQPVFPQASGSLETETSAYPSAARGDFGSQSIVIAVTDSVQTKVRESMPATVATGSALPLPQNGFGQPQVTSSTPPSVQPLADASSIDPISPAVRYVAQRERNRRNQFTLAVFLLIAVVMLAAVLFFVLRHNAQARATQTAGTSGLMHSYCLRVANSSALIPSTAADVQFAIS